MSQPQPISQTQESPVWFITACTSGFGKHIALEALSRGHKVIATSRDSSRLSDLAAAGAETMSLDVTWPLERIQKVAKEAIEKYGKVTHLVNSAGYLLEGAVEEISPEESLATFNTNVLGLLNVTRAFLPHLRTSTSPLKAIANFGSIASWRGGPGYGLYSGTKFAVSGISESLHYELAPFNISVCVFEPGYFRTGFLQGNARIKSEVRMGVYEESIVGRMRAALDETDGRQPGDVGKGACVVVDVLTRTGGREVPIRCVLGSDAVPVVRKKIEETEALLKEWEGVTTGTDHEDQESKIDV
ncbi:NAD(P)-binding protein [Delitschia confertaspora ATCC 74209]|uniref:NAD(P)-binding protein n=1 Tax=Delitschia confertaspora ATCC 74209 TaxID=1513339 RepID=A0A9P4JSD3_9PLEO|nr:NAD(P)-binding protein [Delitschia confertaspora ATCC 74209]